MSSPRRCGRFAPSPTGPLHFGSLVAALASYCDARASGGLWRLRIEDVDEPRSRSDAADDIIRTLDRYGFVWDGPIEWQSARTSLYQHALDRLVASNVAYPCACTRREIELAPLGKGGEHVYPGTCRDGIPADRASRMQRAWRARVGEAVIEYTDRLQGAQRQMLAVDVGDFVIKRADGPFAYQLAVVVDDAEQGVTDVVRGADLIASTPRQIFLSRALRYPPMSYLHVPVAISGAGEKLSKQTGARSLPDDPLPTLAAAWAFLDQPRPPTRWRDVRAFWTYALAAWMPTRLPPVQMLPAPPGA